MPTLEDAIALAVQAHKGQVDKTGAPYILHPLRVMFRLETESERMAAVLHDVVEDTDVGLEMLTAVGYPREVVEAVDSLTRREQETYEAFVERLAHNPLARRVKLADLEDNMDVRRLATVTAKDAERLARYRAAWEKLRAPSQGVSPPDAGD